ncbi:MAG: LacI family DNA-binding transcriptional regulator [Anaerolineales bacterium]
MVNKRVTSFDVAKKAGVSRTTVSLVLNNVPGINIRDETRERIRHVAKELNYHPDSRGRKLASGRSNTIGLVLRQSHEQVFADALLPQVLLGIEQAATAQGFQVLLKPLEPEDCDGYMHLIHENHVDGIILSGPRQDEGDVIRLHQAGLPVMIMGQLPESNLPFVDIDAVDGSTRAVRHLIEHGHRRIAMITNASLEYTSAQQRRSGYWQALTEAGIEPDDSLIQEGGYTPASGYIAMEKLLELPLRPTAVFVASDVVSLGAIRAIKQAGLRIPQHMAVVGFDDIPLADYYDPPLTTIHIPAFELGRSVGDRLMRLVRGESLDQVGVLLESELVIRGSSF